MSAFTASNGIAVQSETQGITGDRRIIFGSGDNARVITFSGKEMRALIETLDHEKDEDLGRWRWFEDAGYVVYPGTTDPARKGVRGVTVLNEQIPRPYTVWEDNIDTLYGTSADEEARKKGRDAARAYFAAHLEPKPAWHDAKPWETWLLTIDDIEHARTLDEDREVRDPAYVGDNSWLHITDARITAGRRIWPEDAA
ncbi:hypothetical protein [Microbacterium sp. zg-YB36]|uniref:hypothetical protein n=1 Tax=Microbacterium sp. zg-YB36 TaxID=2969407 RepID=UPI00214AEE1B|nr:hypothetical protein [Microbacterium sp. zg-YB36]MDL5351144.1 hypothetical protein [Microbacterium sp. zg-YB36]